MALSKVDYNSLNVTAAASKALKWNSGADGFETGDIAGAMVLLETQTASSDSTIDFTSNIDSTYNHYIFKFINIHPSAEGNAVDFKFQVDTGTNTSYNQTMTTTLFRAYHTEADDAAAVDYDSGRDQAQGTGFQIISNEIGIGNDENLSGELHLFNPSSTTFVKHFYTTTNNYQLGDMSLNHFLAGYINTTTAITRVQFKQTSGNIDAGTIKMYGVT